MSEERKSKNVVVSKTKYKVFSDGLQDIVETSEKTDDVLELFCRVFGFDPEKKAYDKERVDRIRAETGLTTYELFQKKHYEKNKAEYDRRNVEKYRKRQQLKKEKEKEKEGTNIDITCKT